MAQSKAHAEQQVRPEPNQATPRPAGNLWSITLLISLVAIVFWPVLGAAFLDWDDTSTVKDNPDLNPPTWQGLARYWTRPHNDLYIPVTYTAWWAIAHVADQEDAPGAPPSLDPHVYHAANLFLHAISAVLVFHILRMLLSDARQPDDSAPPRSRLRAAVAGAMLFAVHPLQVEPVAWISGLKDLLAGMLALLAISTYLLWARTRAQTDRRASTAAIYALATTAFVLAMLAKPSAIVVPAIVIILEWLRRRRRADSSDVQHHWRPAILAMGLWALLALPVLAVGMLAQPAAIVDYPTPLLLRPIVAADALAFYAYKLIVPAWLGVDYGRSPRWLLRVDHVWVWVTWLVPVLAGLVAWRCRNRLPWLAAAMALFVAALMPVLGWVTFDFQYYSTVADHYLYVAMLAPAIALAFALTRWPSRWLQIAALGAVVALAMRAQAQAGWWRDTVSIFSRTLRANPHSIAAHVNLGHVFYEQGNAPDAEAHFRAALQTNPNDCDARRSLGTVLASRQQFEQAIQEYRQALTSARRATEAAEVYCDLGNVYSSQTQWAAAVQEYDQSLKLNPDSAETHTNLAAALMNQQRFPEAVKHFATALRINPNLRPAGVGLIVAQERAERARAGQTPSQQNPPP